MLMPPALKAGDTVALLATARKINTSEIEFALQTLKSWGLNVTVGKTIGLDDNQFAGSDEERLGDLQEQLDNPDVKAIICARGGYGTLRLIDEIDFRKFIKKPKWICGFSDITVLHMHIVDKLGIPVIHSSMPFTFSENTEEALQSLRDFLAGEMVQYKIPSHPLNCNGTVEAELAGGNLSILYSLLGTKFGFSTAGKILFIEDVDEYLYHIDRMMMSLKLAGKLSHIKGLIVGGMNKMKDNTIPFGKSAEEIVLSHVEDLQIPVCFQFPAGHIEDNRALLMGKKIRLDVNEKRVTLEYI